MEKHKHSSGELTTWGTSLLNKLSSVTRNRLKRDASKRRRLKGRQEINREIENSLPDS